MKATEYPRRMRTDTTMCGAISRRQMIQPSHAVATSTLTSCNARAYLKEAHRALASPVQGWEGRCGSLIRFLPSAQLAVQLFGDQPKPVQLEEPASQPEEYDEIHLPTIHMHRKAIGEKETQVEHLQCRPSE